MGQSWVKDSMNPIWIIELALLDIERKPFLSCQSPLRYGMKLVWLNRSIPLGFFVKLIFVSVGYCHVCLRWNSFGLLATTYINMT